MTELKIMPLQKVGYVGSCKTSPAGYEYECTIGYSKPSMDRLASYAMRMLEEARAKDVAAHEANLPAIENNKLVKEAIEQLMNSVGMPKKYSERDEKSRARYPRTVTRDAGYVMDLCREVKINDGFGLATQTYEMLKNRYEEYAADAAKRASVDKAAREKAEAEKIEKRKADMALAAILLRYGLPIESDWDSVLDHLRGLNQRIDLAVAMQDVRGNWSDGPRPVKYALQRFNAVTDEDKAIEQDIESCMEDFDDGRVFRDTTWSYDALYASVAVENKQLVEDVMLAYRNTERY